MGQSWKLVNIDRKERMLSRDNVWEILMGREIWQLDDLIRNPKWIPLRLGTTAYLQMTKSNR